MSPMRPRRLLDAMLIVSVAAVALLGQRVAVSPPPGEAATQVVGVQLARAGDSPGSPPGRDRKVFGIRGHAAGLAPGVGRPLRLTLTNPNNFPIAIDSLSVTVADARAGCPSTYVRVSSFAEPRTVPANGVATTELVVMLLGSAPDDCKNASFPLHYSGTAVKVNQS